MKGKGVKVFMTGGNDDRPEIEEVLKSSKYVVDPEGELLTLEGGYEMISSGWSNPTPWKTPRECSEGELAAKLDAMTSKVQDMDNCVFNLHVPPYDTGLDTCPKLDENLKPVYGLRDHDDLSWKHIRAEGDRKAPTASWPSWPHT